MKGDQIHPFSARERGYIEEMRNWSLAIKC